MKILFVGGGTMGSVSPLLAVAEQLQKRSSPIEFLWVGTQNGPERAVVEDHSIRFKSIHSGKLRRYFSLKNATDLFWLAIGFLQAIKIILCFKPTFIIGAGSYVQVPLMHAAHLVYKPAQIIVHQQDIKKGFANALCSACADLITVSTKKSLKDFPKNKTVYTGNPFRMSIGKGSASVAYEQFKLEKGVPVVLVLGGGTGSETINNLVVESLKKLTKEAQIIHITGSGKKNDISHKRYHAYEFLTDRISHAYAVADIIVTRAGFSTLTELSILAKPLIIIPMHGSHQEQNAIYFKQNHAAIVLDETKTTPQSFSKKILKLFHDHDQRFVLSTQISKRMPADATKVFIEHISKLIDKTIEVKPWNTNQKK